MSDTKALIKYVRDRLNDGPDITFGRPTVRDMVDALEQAEARAEKAEAENVRLQQRVNDLISEELTDGAVRERIQLRFNMHEVLQQNERLTKMVDWLAEKQIRCAANGEQWYGPTISKDLHVPMYPSKNEAIDALKEAARRAVADSEVKG